MIEIIAQYGFNGLVLGANYALIGIGLTMIFGIMNIANFAHGQFYRYCQVKDETSKMSLPSGGHCRLPRPNRRIEVA